MKVHSNALEKVQSFVLDQNWVKVNQTKDGVEDIDVDLNKDKEIERITNRIQNQFNDFVIEDAQSNGQKPLEEELLRIVRLFQ